MVYLYEIWDAIWNFVTDFSWVLGLIAGLYVINHTVNLPYRAHKNYKKGLQNIEGHYELLSENYDLSEPEQEEQWNRQLVIKDRELREHREEYKLILQVNIHSTLVLIVCLLSGFLVFWTIKSGYPF